MDPEEQLRLERLQKDKETRTRIQSEFLFVFALLVVGFTIGWVCCWIRYNPGILG